MTDARVAPARSAGTSSPGNDESPLRRRVASPTSVNRSGPESRTSRERVGEVATLMQGARTRIAQAWTSTVDRVEAVRDRLFQGRFFVVRVAERVETEAGSEADGGEMRTARVSMTGAPLAKVVPAGIVVSGDDEAQTGCCKEPETTQNAINRRNMCCLIVCCGIISIPLLAVVVLFGGGFAFPTNFTGPEEPVVPAPVPTPVPAPQ